jgi:hypothetical protein
MSEVVARGGILQHGDYKKIALAVACDRSTVSRLMNEHAPSALRFRAELNRRLEDLPIGDPRRQLGMLSRILNDALERRVQQNRPLSKKDPVEIIDVARRITQGEAYLSLWEQQQERDTQPQVFIGVSKLSDEELEQRIEALEQKLLEGDLSDVTIDADFTEVEENLLESGTDAGFAGDAEASSGGPESREEQADTDESPETPSDQEGVVRMDQGSVGLYHSATSD